jgi:hypothetical protein
MMDDERMTGSFQVEDLDMEGDKLTSRKPSSVVYEDPVADLLLKYYSKITMDDNEMVRFVFLAAPFGIIMFFYMFVSNSTSSMISFTAFIVSLVFLGVSMWMLCEILKKDVGPRSMQDIAEVIREGSEGFFMT